MTTGRKSSWFTLVELLVVIGVIVILGALLLPGVSKARRRARSIACASQIRQVGMALQMYLGDYGDVMPLVAAMPSLGLNSNPRLVDVLSPYVEGVNDVFHCPADVGTPVYFETEGSSYQLHGTLAGRQLDDSFLTRRFGASATPVAYDYVPFHGEAGTAGASNYLFADGHVGIIE